MFKNYFTIAWRNIRKYKAYSFITIFGLALGMACCILIFLWVQDEMNYDRFHKNINELFRVVRSSGSNEGSIEHYAGTPSPLGPTLKEYYPEVIDFVRFYKLSQLKDEVLIQSGDNKFYERGFCYTDQSFFSMFTFSFIYGNASTALMEPNSVVITKKIAEKYFGNKNAIGKTLNIVNWRNYKVTGVIENIPNQSHLQFDFLSPIEPLIKQFAWMQKWNIPHFFTYLRLKNNIDVSAFNEKISKHLLNYDPDLFKDLRETFSLQPVKDIHLYSNYKADINGNSEDQTSQIIFFSAIAMFVLLIACINFINLTTARAADRAREVGVRKVIGASRKTLAYQFFGESLLMSLSSLLLATIIVLISLPAFNILTGKQLQPYMLLNTNILFGIIGIITITSILSGIYPALVLSSFQPVSIIRGTITNLSKRNFVRRSLVIFQFTLSLILMIGTVIIYKQLGYIQNKELGYNKDFLVYFNLQENLSTQFNAFKNEVLQNKQIISVTRSSDIPTSTDHITSFSDWEGNSNDDRIMMNFCSVDEDFSETFKLDMQSGRFFSKDFSSDASEAFIVNEEATKQMGMQNPIGKQFNFFGRTGQIIGVVKDYHFKSLHQEIEPLLLWMDNYWYKYIFLKLNTERISESIDYVENIYRKFNPGYPFEFKFLDQDFEQLYKVDYQTKQVLQLFAGFAIFISCIGLFGLASFTIKRRTKEIGIRKIVGASVPNIVALLTTDFVKWVLIANIIAWPIAYYIMNNWLQDFAYRINLTIWPFLLSGIIAIIISVATVSYQSIKAAIANPVKSLKYE